MNMFVLPPKGDFIRFANDEEYEEKTRLWGLNTAKTVKKEFLYKEKDKQCKAKIIGYEVHGTHHTLVIELEEGKQLTCIHPAYLKEMQTANFGKVSLIPEAEAEAEEVKAKPIKKEKKQAAPTLALPEEKVSCTATVVAFETKYNAFTEEDDKIILYDHVSITSEPPLEVGKAWSSYSKSLEKLEIAIGDNLSFDAKIVKKKFDKEVLYKINNPSKLVKK